MRRHCRPKTLKGAVYAVGKQDFTEYRYEPARYIREKLGWTPWSGTAEQPGQQQIIDAYTLALQQQHERRAFEMGELTEDQLTVWQPGVKIQNWIRVEAGHTVGKTKLSSGLVNHFFDCFGPSIIYTFAPTWDQIKDLLWKEIGSDREGKGLPGRLLETCELKLKKNWFAKGRATNNAGGKGTERVHGQHNAYLMFVLDEAEGIPQFVYDAVKSMAGGGICIVIMLANPRTRISPFYKLNAFSHVKSFRMSCLGHPNVQAGKEIVPYAVRRDYVEGMIEEHCEVVSAHNEDDCTFSVPFPVTKESFTYPSGVIWKPDSEFMFRVQGIAPANIADDTFIPVGRYESAVKRGRDIASGRKEREDSDPRRAWIGIDAAGYGNDLGSIFVRHRACIWRAAQCSKLSGDQDPTDYWHKTRKAALALAEQGVKSLHIRIDAGGGFGNGVYDRLKRDEELIRAFPDYQLFMVHFGGECRDKKSYRDLGTEMYAQTAESIKGLAILTPPERLLTDLTERRWVFINWQGKELKKLDDKKHFRSDTGHSPDDGDAFVLCAAPDFLFLKGGSYIAGGAPSGGNAVAQAKANLARQGGVFGQKGSYTPR